MPLQKSPTRQSGSFALDIAPHSNLVRVAIRPATETVVWPSTHIADAGQICGFNKHCRHREVDEIDYPGRRSPTGALSPHRPSGRLGWPGVGHTLPPGVVDSAPGRPGIPSVHIYKSARRPGRDDGPNRLVWFPFSRSPRRSRSHRPCFTRVARSSGRLPCCCTPPAWWTAALSAHPSTLWSTSSENWKPMARARRQS